MNKEKKSLRVDSDPIYDDWTLEEHTEYETKELLTALVDHILKLQNEVVSLRKVLYRNDPYADIYSDLCPSFEDFPAYRKFREILLRLS